MQTTTKEVNKFYSIAIVICYFGKFPWYFEYFLHSCKYNKMVDFIIITDNSSEKYNLSSNVAFIPKTLEDIAELVTDKLGLIIKLTDSYKLCDFKPAYGVLFDDLLKDYDFWGHGDIDVIYGDIRSFITPEILSSHDLISVRHDFLSGYFLLFKNERKLNYLFTESKDYKMVFESEKHYCFDETNFEHKAFTKQVPYSEIHSEIESMMHVVRKLEDRGDIKPYFEFHVVEGVPGQLRWSEGKLFFKDKFEVLLYHLIVLKTVYVPDSVELPIPNSFFITPQSIVHN